MRRERVWVLLAWRGDFGEPPREVLGVGDQAHGREGVVGEVCGWGRGLALPHLGRAFVAEEGAEGHGVPAVLGPGGGAVAGA